MPLLNLKLRKLLSVLVLFALAFNGTASVFLANSLVDHAQSFADEDKVLICTGKSYQWISMQRFHQTGEIQVVAPPTDAPENITKVKCSYVYLSDSNLALPSVNSVSFTLLPTLHTRTNTYVSASRSLIRHQLALSRAPPFFS